MYWLVYQSLVISQNYNHQTMANDVHIQVHIRKVEAFSKEEAIGKFILDTADIKFSKRVEPITCFEFDKLKTI